MQSLSLIALYILTPHFCDPFNFEISMVFLDSSRKSRFFMIFNQGCNRLVTQSYQNLGFPTYLQKLYFTKTIISPGVPCRFSSIPTTTPKRAFFLKSSTWKGQFLGVKSVRAPHMVLYTKIRFSKKSYFDLNFIRSSSFFRFRTLLKK